MDNIKMSMARFIKIIRMRRVLSIPLLLLVIFSAGLQPAVAQGSKNQPVKIVMFGNSITHGADWSSLLGRSDVVNRGLPGYSSGQLLWTVGDVMIRLPGTKIWFIEGGINDIYLGVPVRRIYRNFQVMIDSLVRNDIIPVVQSTIYKLNVPRENRNVTRINRVST